MTAAIPARGTLLKMDDGLGVYTTIAEVKDIGGPTRTRDTIDVTNHSSPGSYREFLGSFKDSGELPFTVNFLPTNATHDNSTGLEALYESGTQRNFRIEAPSPSTLKYQFAAIVTEFGNTWNLDDVIMGSFTLKISGGVSRV